jgi:hypothetical protein
LDWIQLAEVGYTTENTKESGPELTPGSLLYPS